jgi:hypothetical protein
VHWQWLGLAYFGYLAVVAAAWPARFGRARWPAFGLLAAAALLLVVRHAFDLDDGRLPLVARALMPVVVLLAGYWLSGRFFVRPMRWAEGCLLGVDRVLIEESGVLRRYRAAHWLVRTYFELAYLLVYVVVPAGALTLVLGGQADQLDRFWGTVLLAGLACYGALPWIQTRPPRALATGPDDAAAGSFVRRLNLAVLGRASIVPWPLPWPSERCCRGRA